MQTITVKFFRSCVHRSRINTVVKAMAASFSCMTMHTLESITEIRANWIPRAGRYSSILHTAQSYCYATFTSGDDLQEVVVQWFRQQSKEFFGYGIHWLGVNTLLYIYLWWLFFNCCNTFTNNYPQMGFSCTWFILKFLHDSLPDRRYRNQMK